MTYRVVLRRPEMKAVLGAHAISLTGTVAAEVALSVLIYRRTGSPLLSALTLACAFVPQAFSAVLLSGLVDRVAPRRLLVTCDLACAVLVACMVVPGTPVAVLLGLAAVIGLITPLFTGARAATLADLLDDEAWVLARSLLRILSQSALLLGFAVGGLALVAIGPRSLLALDAASFVASAGLLRFGTSMRPARSRRPGALARKGLAREGVAATVRALRAPVLRRLLLMTWLPSTCLATLDGLATPYAGGRSVSIGLLLAAAALGSVLAEVLGTRLRIASRPGLVRPVAALTGVALLGYALHPPIWVAVGLNLVGALGGAVGQALDQRLLAALPTDGRGQVLALQNGLLMAIQGAGIAVAGALAEVASPSTVLTGAGVLDLLCVALLLRDGRREAPRDPRPQTRRRTTQADPVVAPS